MDRYCPKGHTILEGDKISRAMSTGGYPASYYCKVCDKAYPEDQLCMKTYGELGGVKLIRISERFDMPCLSEDILLEKGVDVKIVADMVREILVAIGEDPDREGLVDTPMRVAKFWKEFIEYDDNNINTTFEAIRADQMVVVTGIKTWSLCEHHLLPFNAVLSIGYIPKSKDDGGEERILGLSKIPRIVHKHAHGLQVQERLVSGIADEIRETIDVLGVAVVCSGIHTCMVMRGIKTDGVMTTSRLTGSFRRQAEVRSEFFSLINHAQEFGRW